MYHRLAERVAGVPEPTINVTPAQFRRQLVGLKERGYEFWPLSRILHQWEQGQHSLPARVTALTFDDGHRTVFSEGFATLRELRIPATILLNTAYLDSSDPFPFDHWAIQNREHLPASAYCPLETAQCREMLASGLIELGVHTHTHGNFRGRPEAFQADLQTSVDILGEQFGIQHPSFAFPIGRRALGYVTPELIAAARRTGVRCALTTDVGLISSTCDPFGWGRFNVYDWDSPATLAARLRGWYAWAPRIQDRLTQLTRGKQGAAL
jgi:peptidoglycan/xylan/chitin deacetylase (PgdA/CDA1 family)